ncbi:MAG TPA: hypothetical protein VMJ11_08850 [Paraburkholderia sp.]|uniref:hypothetical protein n=1 Tax=Paraburkholderia sp. TaxID=1926495 RepID=UPI002C8AF897|nr:hypothetical protein [Paraburkholderia sp.]HTR06748.1 hypothetical protein [Paraburkholderia sp.]
MDILQVEKGRKFDVVRTVPATPGDNCPMVSGQWMWLCPLDEMPGFEWKGIKLRS